MLPNAILSFFTLLLLVDSSLLIFFIVSVLWFSFYSSLYGYRSISNKSKEEQHLYGRQYRKEVKCQFKEQIQNNKAKTLRATTFASAKLEEQKIYQKNINFILNYGCNNIIFIATPWEDYILVVLWPHPEWIISLLFYSHTLSRSYPCCFTATPWADHILVFL